MEWWNVWVPFIGTLIALYFNINSTRTQDKNNEKFTEKMNELQIEFEKQMVKKKIDADLKAKARIEWINKVRNLASKLICKSGDLNRSATATTNHTLRYIEVKRDAVIESRIAEPILKFAMELEEENDAFLPEYSDTIQAYFKKADSQKDDFIKNLSEFYYTGQELLMYFSESTEHDKIIRLIEHMIFTTNQFEEAIKNNLFTGEKDFKIIDSYTLDLEKDIQSFSYEMKKYLKKEWDKAKEGK